MTIAWRWKCPDCGKTMTCFPPEEVAIPEVKMKIQETSCIDCNYKAWMGKRKSRKIAIHVPIQLEFNF
jgi:DNA-directed RNA polymerase subunit RPC12/RpoP